ncbi:hypothetical protein [Nocardioides zeae]|uniref:Secreted protein n=1 Tax=Nocardioides zeae TaxID=1457234 RepID=A0A6P0HMZ3_9ACTN|nr:hypothetical protein [Nocardioides zeae]NEN80001.1 hypothetical protein [Nocardioides zeae]
MKKLLVAIISTVVMAVGVLAGSAATAQAAEGYPGQYSTGSRLTPDPISNVGKAGTGKGFTIFYAGEPGVRLNGTAYVSIRRYGTSTVQVKQYRYTGTTRYFTTPTFTPGVKANYRVTITFVPDDEQFRPSVRAWNVWVTVSGRA